MPRVLIERRMQRSYIEVELMLFIFYLKTNKGG